MNIELHGNEYAIHFTEWGALSVVYLKVYSMHYNTKRFHWRRLDSHGPTWNRIAAYAAEYDLGAQYNMDRIVYEICRMRDRESEGLSVDTPAAIVRHLIISFGE